MSKKAPNDKLTNAEIVSQVDIRRACFRGNEDEENPEKTLKDKKQQHRMLEISIKLAKALSKLPTVKQRLIFIEQRFGKDCLCDSPSKLELLFQKCGGFDSPTIGENLMQALNGLFLTLKRGTIKDPSKLNTQILGVNKDNVASSNGFSREPRSSRSCTRSSTRGWIRIRELLLLSSPRSRSMTSTVLLRRRFRRE